MTSLSKRKTKLSVEFSETVREQGKLREVIMDFHPYGVTVRLKGLRTGYEISPGAIWSRAALLAVEKSRAEKRATRKRR